MGSTDSRGIRTPAVAALCLLPAMMAGADIRSSSNDYRIKADVLDAGGGMAASEAYQITGSAGGISAVHRTDARMDRAGFIGQLYEIRGIVFPRSPVYAGEGETIALAVSEIWDDGSTFFPSVAGVSWQIDTENAPASISPDGVVETFPVHTDTMVTIIARRYEFFVLLTLVVRNTIEDNFGFYAGDGLPDWWQYTHFGPDNPDAAPHLDPDGDGEDNLTEFLALTDPLSPVGRFDAEPFRGPDGPMVSFPTVAGQQYWLEASGTLSDGWVRIDGPLEGTGDTRSFVLPVEPGQPARFFRVVSAQ